MWLTGGSDECGADDTVRWYGSWRYVLEHAMESYCLFRAMGWSLIVRVAALEVEIGRNGWPITVSSGSKLTSLQRPHISEIKPRRRRRRTATKKSIRSTKLTRAYGTRSQYNWL